MKVCDMQQEERPRERMLRLGAAALSDREIMAILLRVGYKGVGVMELAEELTKGGRIYKELVHMNTMQEFQQIKGLGGMQKSSTLLAAVELGRRIAKYSALNDMVEILEPRQVYNLLAPDLRYEAKEHFYVVALSNKSKVLGYSDVSVGTLTGSLVHPREVFKFAVLHNAAKVIVAHNHPSGEPEPSREDRNVTRMLREAGEIMGIPLVDHVIIGDGKFYSFSDNGAI